MKLGQLLNVTELHQLMQQGYISLQRHPSLPLGILNYTNKATFDNFWPEPVQVCRGLIIDPTPGHEPCDDCNVVARPFHKFFNLNQEGRPETNEINLAGIGEPTITEKMDGWFGILWGCKDLEGQSHYGVASRGSFVSPGAEFATGKLAKLVKYGAIEEFPAGYTPVFEIIFKAGKIVVDYPYEGLVLLALINNETGEEMPYEEMRNVWAKIASYSKDNRPWIRIVHAHRMSLSECALYSGKNFEGFVASYPRPGERPIKVKIKLEEYKRLHRLITGVTPQQIWTALYDPMAPWLGGGVPDHFRSWALKWRDELYSEYHKRMSGAIRLADGQRSIGVDLAMLKDKHDRHVVFDNLLAHDPDYAHVAMALLDEKIYEAHQAVWKMIRPVGREHEIFYREGQGE